jgi:glycosyltransferase involved in cell wall biosynthesis
MHILYLHQYFLTRSSKVGGTRSFEFARYLRGQGHKVTLITAAPEQIPSGRATRTRAIEGIEVIELSAGYADHIEGTRMSYRRRISNFLHFALACTWQGLRVPKPDLVFATSTPLTIGIPGLIISKFRRVPHVFEVRDLWPEAPIQMGALKSPLLISLARWMERTIYRHSAHIVALSPGMRDGVVAAGIPENKVTTIPNSSDLDLFSPSVDGSHFRKKLGLNGRFTCTYFGTMGAANGLNFVLDAASELKKRDVTDVALVLHGDGKERQTLESRCAADGLSNVIFSDPVAGKEAIAGLAAAADVCMTIYKNLPILYTCSPNKMFDSLAAGKPVLVNMPGWLQSLVEQHNAGVFVQPDNPVDFADKLIFLRDNPELCAEYGRNARQLAEDEFARRKLAEKLEKIFLEVQSSR